MTASVGSRWRPELPKVLAMASGGSAGLAGGEVAHAGSPVASAGQMGLLWLSRGCTTKVSRLKRGSGLLGGRLGLQRPWRRGVDGDAHAGALWAPVGCHGDLGVRVGACVPSG